jgi:hypothetical protein
MHIHYRLPPRSWMLQLQTICYIEPVLAFGTEQDIIVNSHCPSSNVPKGQVGQSSMSFTKSATCESGIVFSEFENDLVGKSNQVLAKEYSGELLVYLLEI